MYNRISTIQTSKFASVEMILVCLQCLTHYPETDLTFNLFKMPSKNLVDEDIIVRHLLT